MPQPNDLSKSLVCLPSDPGPAGPRVRIHIPPAASLQTSVPLETLARGTTLAIVSPPTRLSWRNHFMIGATP